MDLLKSKAQDMLKTGHQSNAVAETQEVFDKFDNISNKVKVMYNYFKIIILDYYYNVIQISEITQSA